MLEINQYPPSFYEPINKNTLNNITEKPPAKKANNPSNSETPGKNYHVSSSTWENVQSIMHGLFIAAILPV